MGVAYKIIGVAVIGLYWIQATGHFLPETK